MSIKKILFRDFKQLGRKYNKITEALNMSLEVLRCQKDEKEPH